MKHGILVFLLTFYCGIISVFAQNKKNDGLEDRKTWLAFMDKIARPVLSNLADDKLKDKMVVGLSPKIDNPENRTKVAYLEAFGRTMSGIAPWLNLEGGSKEEVALREQYRKWALKAIDNTTNPNAKDYLQWTGGQPLVDASFLALALVRCPWLWEHLDKNVQNQVIAVFKSTRSTVPVYSNWLLFSAMIETFFCKYNQEYDPVRIEYALREFFNHWYVGDGVFSDGMEYHWDYYNSIVIHPYLANILDVVGAKSKTYSGFAQKFDAIQKRYAEIQERMIHTDGSFPVTGRSIVYRGAAFHHLADIALRKKLPASLKPAQIRGALTATIRKTLESPVNFTKEGWLVIGLAGNQPDLADSYITTGSLYICTNIFLPLGLPETDEFWNAPAEGWTSVKVWGGQNFPADHALDIH